MRPEGSAKGKIIVFGILFWYPLAGVTFQFLHFLLGLRRLGYDVSYVEDSGRWVYDPRVNDLTDDASGNIAAVAPLLEAHGFAGRWAFRGHYPGGRCYGMTDGEIQQIYGEADALLNVTGAQEIREEHLRCPRRIYIETDPVASQLQVVHGEERMIAMLSAHDMHFSFGENLGNDDCGVPVERFRWLPTRQPVILDLWANPHGGSRSAYTTIATWRNLGKDVTYRGETYFWSKDREFLKFLDLPRRCTVAFELATTASDGDRSLLHEHGWRQTDPLSISRDCDRYRDYIFRSRGEFTVAKDQNIRLRSGWFSDRSACYLAAGLPVITQETGFSKFLPTGRGLFAFRTLEDIVAAVDAVEMDYAGNCRAAREIATEYFAAERVLARLMDRAGL
jgi:hypothetical protein